MTETSHFDWPRFAADVKTFLGREALTYRAASARFGGAYAMWYRAQAGRPLSVGNALFVARTAGMDIYAYSVFAQRSHVKQAANCEANPAFSGDESRSKQPVTPVSCENGAETEARAPAEVPA